MPILLKFIIGHNVKIRPIQTVNGHTHDWELFVQGVNGADISLLVQKIVVNLHPTFSNPKRILTEPPFVVRESGYGGFELTMDFYFRYETGCRRVSYNYDLRFDIESGNVLMQHVFDDCSEDLRKILLAIGGIPVHAVKSHPFLKSSQGIDQVTPLDNSTARNVPLQEKTKDDAPKSKAVTRVLSSIENDVKVENQQQQDKQAPRHRSKNKQNSRRYLNPEDEFKAAFGEPLLLSHSKSVLKRKAEDNFGSVPSSNNGSVPSSNNGTNGLNGGKVKKLKLDIKEEKKHSTSATYGNISDAQYHGNNEKPNQHMTSRREINVNNGELFENNLDTVHRHQQLSSYKNSSNDTMANGCHQTEIQTTASQVPKANQSKRVSLNGNKKMANRHHQYNDINEKANQDITSQRGISVNNGDLFEKSFNSGDQQHKLSSSKRSANTTMMNVHLETDIQTNTSHVQKKDQSKRLRLNDDKNMTNRAEETVHRNGKTSSRKAHQYGDYSEEMKRHDREKSLQCKPSTTAGALAPLNKENQRPCPTYPTSHTSSYPTTSKDIGIEITVPKSKLNYTKLAPALPTNQILPTHSPYSNTGHNIEDANLVPLEDVPILRRLQLKKQNSSARLSDQQSSKDSANTTMANGSHKTEIQTNTSQVPKKDQSKRISLNGEKNMTNRHEESNHRNGKASSKKAHQYSDYSEEMKRHDREKSLQCKPPPSAADLPSIKKENKLPCSTNTNSHRGSFHTASKDSGAGITVPKSKLDYTNAALKLPTNEILPTHPYYSNTGRNIKDANHVPLEDVPILRRLQLKKQKSSAKLSDQQSSKDSANTTMANGRHKTEIQTNTSQVPKTDQSKRISLNGDKNMPNRPEETVHRNGKTSSKNTHKFRDYSEEMKGHDREKSLQCKPSTSSGALAALNKETQRSRPTYPISHRSSYHTISKDSDIEITVPKSKLNYTKPASEMPTNRILPTHSPCSNTGHNIEDANHVCLEDVPILRRLQLKKQNSSAKLSDQQSSKDSANTTMANGHHKTDIQTTASQVPKKDENRRISLNGDEKKANRYDQYHAPNEDPNQHMTSQRGINVNNGDLYEKSLHSAHQHQKLSSPKNSDNTTTANGHHQTEIQPTTPRLPKKDESKRISLNGDEKKANRHDQYHAPNEDSNQHMTSQRGINVNNGDLFEKSLHSAHHHQKLSSSKNNANTTMANEHHKTEIRTTTSHAQKEDESNRISLNGDKKMTNRHEETNHRNGKTSSKKAHQFSDFSEEMKRHDQEKSLQCKPSPSAAALSTINKENKPPCPTSPNSHRGSFHTASKDSDVANTVPKSKLDYTNAALKIPANDFLPAHPCYSNTGRNIEGVNHVPLEDLSNLRPLQLKKQDSSEKLRHQQLPNSRPSKRPTSEEGKYKNRNYKRSYTPPPIQQIEVNDGRTSIKPEKEHVPSNNVEEPLLTVSDDNLDNRHIATCQYSQADTDQPRSVHPRRDIRQRFGSDEEYINSIPAPCLSDDDSDCEMLPSLTEGNEKHSKHCDSLPKGNKYQQIDSGCPTSRLTKPGCPSAPSSGSSSSSSFGSKSNSTSISSPGSSSDDDERYDIYYVQRRHPATVPDHLFTKILLFVRQGLSTLTNTTKVRQIIDRLSGTNCLKVDSRDFEIDLALIEWTDLVAVHDIIDGD